MKSGSELIRDIDEFAYVAHFCKRLRCQWKRVSLPLQTFVHECFVKVRIDPFFFSVDGITQQYFV